MQLYIRLTGSTSSNSHGLKFSTDFNGRTCGELKLHLSGPAHECGDVATLRLIFKGRILADDDAVLEEMGIRQGATLFLVVVAPPPPSAGNQNNNKINNSSSTSSPTKKPAAPSTTMVAAAAARTDPIAAAAAPSNNSSSFAFGTSMPNNNSNNSAASAANPSWPSPTIDNSIDNPLLQSMMQTNPDVVTNLLQQQLQNNPALQRLMDQNPLLREVLNDPAELRRLLQLQSNPDVRQQQQRLADLALQRAETLPGGFNALRQMYETMQVPLEESLTLNNNNTTGNDNATTNNSNNQHAGATGQAMPNPWGSNRSANNSSNNNNADPMASLMLPNADSSTMLASMLGNGNGNALFPPNLLPGATSNNNLSSSPFGNNNNNMLAAMEDPRVQQLMEQMVTQNPQMMRQFLPPQLQHMTDAQLQDMMRWTLQHPELLRNAPPPSFLAPGGASNTAGMPYSANPGMDFSSLFLGGSNRNTSTNVTHTSNTTNYNPWATPTTPSSTTAVATTTPPPATTMPWVYQLQQMRDMGFANEVANRAALQQAHGNLNRAVDLLLLSNNNQDESSPASNNHNNNEPPTPPDNDSANDGP